MLFHFWSKTLEAVVAVVAVVVEAVVDLEAALPDPALMVMAHQVLRQQVLP
jgi:hypothetical protein